MRILPLLLSAALILATVVATPSAAQAADGSCTAGTRSEQSVPKTNPVGKLVVAVDKTNRTASACFYRVGEAAGGLADLYVEISGSTERKVQGPAHYNTPGGHAGPVTVTQARGTCVLAGGWIKWKGATFQIPKSSVC